jgi:hypothetical protein
MRMGDMRCCGTINKRTRVLLRRLGYAAHRPDLKLCVKLWNIYG